ncbi:MAG: biopolymer transporter ExbD [Psychrobium sp.]|nr:biopolymer transporter ExbD [Psychrobium sp.]
MAFNLPSDTSDELPEQHEINVTPFIDVMLVLLIIFMIAAPLATVSVPVNLPSVATPQQRVDDVPTYLTLQQDLTLTLGDSEVVDQLILGQELQRRGIDVQQPLLLRADSAVSYGDLMALMNTLAQAGYNKIALVGLEKLS